MKRMKKIMALVLSIAMVLSITSCSAFSTSSKNDKKSKRDRDEEEESDDEDEVIAVVEDFSKALIDGNIDKMLKYCIDDDDFEDDLEDLFEFEDDLDRDDEELLDAILVNIEYKIDKKSIDIDDDEATVDVTYYLPDLSTVDYDDLEDDPEEAIEDADKREVKVTFKIEIDDDEYLITNPVDIAEDTRSSYALSGFEKPTGSHNEPVQAVVDDIDEDEVTVKECILGDDLESSYTDVTEIDMCLKLDSRYKSIDDCVVRGIYKYNDIEFYREGLEVELDFYIGKSSNAPMDKDGYLSEGTYTIEIYDTNNNLIYSTSTQVLRSSQSNGAPSSGTGTDITSGKAYVAYIDYTDAFVNELGFDNFTPVGRLQIGMYLVLGDDATLSINGQEFKDNVTTFVTNNLDAIFINQAGMSAQEVAEASGMTLPEFQEYFASLLLEEIDTSSFDAAKATGSYEISGSTITIKFPGNTLVGTISGNAITVDVSAVPQFAQYTSNGNLVFNLQG